MRGDRTRKRVYIDQLVKLVDGQPPPTPEDVQRECEVREQIVTWMLAQAETMNVVTQ